MILPGKKISLRGSKKQHGSVLIVSLILLIAIAVLGLTSMVGSNTNERITANLQQKSIGFQVSESAIKSVWAEQTLMGNIPVTPRDNPPSISISLGNQFDQDKVTVTGEVTIQFCGEDILPVGSSLNADESAVRLAAVLVDIHGIAAVASANTDHLQRAMVIRPLTGREGDCS